MLLIVLTTLLMAIPLYSSTITPTLLTRITSITLLFSAAISFNALYVQTIGYGLGLYSGLFHVTTVTQAMEIFLFVVGAFILLGYASESPSFQDSLDVDGDRAALNLSSNNTSTPGLMSTSTPSISEYPLIILFTTIGATFLISSSDLVSMYLSIELQSFAVYILAAIYRNSESATSAGLKYFLLGALSSALILLGSSLIYAYTGLTSLESISIITNCFQPVENASDSTVTLSSSVILGALIIVVGLLFKVAAAPFHNWAPDVYDGVPTIVTTWLTVMPKISIFIFLLEIIHLFVVPDMAFNDFIFLTGNGNGVIGGLSDNDMWKTLLLTTSVLSLIIGTVVGLSQYRLKRLLAYSTISHVGFLLLALSVNSVDSINSFLFYLMQYSITNLNTFFIVLAFGYIISNKMSKNKTIDIAYIAELKGQFLTNPVLGLSLAICLFSMAGIPPLMGFFAKYMVLYSAIENGYYFLALIGILASVVSASYYLRIIRVVFVQEDNDVSNYGEENGLTSHLRTGQGVFQGNLEKAKARNNYKKYSKEILTSTHSYIIAVLTLFITLYILSPSLFLNSSNLLALSLFTA